MREETNYDDVEERCISPRMKRSQASATKMRCVTEGGRAMRDKRKRDRGRR
jgi:hypothetical protein